MITVRLKIEKTLASGNAHPTTTSARITVMRILSAGIIARETCLIAATAVLVIQIVLQAA